MARAAAGQKDTIAVAVMLESRADQANEDDCAAGVVLRVFVRDGLLHGARHRIVSPRCSQGWSVQGAASPQAGPMWEGEGDTWREAEADRSAPYRGRVFPGAPPTLKK